MRPRGACTKVGTDVVDSEHCVGSTLALNAKSGKPRLQFPRIILGKPDAHPGETHTTPSSILRGMAAIWGRGLSVMIAAPVQNDIDRH